MSGIRAWMVALPIMALATGVAAQGHDATEHFGRGIANVADNGTTVRLDLRTGAHGLLLRVSQHDPVLVLRAGEFAAGRSDVRIPARQIEVAQATANPGSGVDAAQAERDARLERRNCEGPSEGKDRLIAAMNHAECQGIQVMAWQPTRTTTALRAPPREYLILVVSDLPLDTADVLARLATLPAFEPATAAHDVAEHLVGRRGGTWAGYLARR